MAQRVSVVRPLLTRAVGAAAVLLCLYVSSLNDVRDVPLFDAPGFSADEHIQQRCGALLGLHGGCFAVERKPGVCFRVTVRPPPAPLCLTDDMMLPTFRYLDKYVRSSPEGVVSPPVLSIYMVTMDVCVCVVGSLCTTTLM